MNVFNEFDLSNYNSYKIKAICQKAFFPENENELRNLISQEKVFSEFGVNLQLEQRII